MSYNRLAVLAALRTELVNGTCNPSRGLAELAGRLLCDDTFNKTALHTIAEHRCEAAALLWIRIADHLSGQPRIESLALAAVFAFKAGCPSVTATLIDRAQIAARRELTELPAPLDILKLDHRVKAHRQHSPA